MAVKLTERAAQKVAQVIRGFNAMGIDRRPLPVDDPQRPQLYQSMFRIGASASADSTPRNRFVYTVTEVYKSGAGPDGWTTKLGGISGSIGYNGLEIPNIASDGTSPTLTGSGADIDHDFFASPLTVWPIQPGCVVQGTLHLIELPNGTQSREVWFESPNHVWGDPCPRSPATMAEMGDDAERTTTDTTNDWQACRNVEGVGVVGAKLFVQTGTFYDHTVSTPDLKAQAREVRFDKYGRCYSVSIEAAYIVDTPEAC